MAKEMSNAVREVADIMQFENWLRFYFVEDREDGLYLTVPEQSEQRIREEYPEYLELLDALNNEPVTYEKSVQTVCQFVIQTLDGQKYKPGVINRVFESKGLQKEMQLFGLWQNHHEDQLDKAFLDFNKWRELFSEWKESDEVREYFQQLREKASQVAEGDDDTVQ